MDRTKELELFLENLKDTDWEIYEINKDLGYVDLRTKASGAENFTFTFWFDEKDPVNSFLLYLHDNFVDANVEEYVTHLAEMNKTMDSSNLVDFEKVTQKGLDIQDKLNELFAFLEDVYDRNELGDSKKFDEYIQEQEVKKELEKFKDFVERIEETDWTLTSFDVNAGCVEFESYSPAGENLVETVWFKKDDTINSFLESLYDLYENFDIEEHVKVLLEAKENGFGGVPDVVTLVDDAKEIENMFEELYDFFNDIYKREILGKETKNIDFMIEDIEDITADEISEKQMLIYMINTYVDEKYGSSVDYQEVKEDIMTATGMTERYFNSIKNELDFVAFDIDRDERDI